MIGEKYFASTLLFLILLSCNDKIKEVNEPVSWGQLTITTQFQNITIDKYSDSCEVEQIIWDKGIYKIPSTYKIIDTLKSKIYLTKIEKDSLSNWIISSIIKPKFTNLNASDYVGNVKFNLKYLNTNLSCEYKSVGNWNKVSDITQKIYNLLSQKTELSQQ